MLVMCWNMQGAGSGKGTSNASDALGFLHKGGDVLLLQEAGGYPQGWGLKASNVGGVTLMEGQINIGTSHREKMAHVVWYDSTDNTNAKHDRCSMAVIATDYSGVYGVETHHNAGLRPLIGIKSSAGIWCFSIHAPSGNHKAAAGVANTLIGGVTYKKYIVAGDFNCSPGDMQGKGYATCNASGGTHQNGNTLDFAIGKGVTIDLVSAGKLGLPALVSDHYSQCFSVQ